jgi:hypothetical protein
LADITRYEDKNIVVRDSTRFYEIRRRIDTTRRNDDGLYEVKGEMSLRQIAGDPTVYNDARLYWIIAEFNKIHDPFLNLQPGTVVRYPSMKRINEEYFGG